MTPHTPLASAPPPPSAQWMVSDDPDEVSSWVTQRDGYHSRVVHGTGPYGFRLARIGSQRVRLSWATTRLPNSLRASFPMPTFHLPLRGIQQYKYGRRHADVAAGALAFMAPGAEATRYSDCHPLLAIDLDPSTFASELHSRRAAPCEEWPRVPLFPVLTPFQRHELHDAVEELVRAHERDGDASARIHVEFRLLSALAAVVPTRPSLAVNPMSARRIARLEEWIDANLGEPITVGRLCEVARCGERSLQMTFQARRAMSPMRFVAERRLTAAHRILADAERECEVTTVAASLGFSHFGRFASAYRAIFGELPSQTLLRSRRWAPARSVAAPVARSARRQPA